MNVTTGTRLGPYEIVSRLGAGGMGEVWSARDTRLDRRVAVKILPAELAHDAKFKLRFEREAKTISQLSHPNICTLHDVGEDFLVMELLEGETLADRLAKGPLPMPDVLRYGMQIAEALGTAHRMGIVHRDLKPANVMITRAGTKLLDFGLAKSAVPVVDVDGATQHRPLTQEGTILGTFQYMAPEQLEGQEADARTDIFALGAVLYEMATSRRAFEGKTKTSLIAQIVSAEPKPLHDLVPLTPPAFEHVVARCLSKDPDQRWQNALDIAEELRWISTANAATPVQGSRSRVVPWALTGVALAAAIVAGAALLLRAAPQPVRWVDIAPPKEVRLVTLTDRGGSAIAPDGNRVVFAGKDNAGLARLYVRELGSGEVRPLAGTEGASFPFWSPDSRSVAFFTDGKLKRIDVGGTRPAVIAENVDGRGGAWGADGTIVFAPTSTAGLSRVRATGGAPAGLTELKGDQTSHRFPSFHPEGRHLLYLAQGGRDAGIYAASLDGRLNRRLMNPYDAAVFAGNAVVFARDGSLFAQDLDLETLEPQGEPREIASGVTAKQNAFNSCGLSASAAGELLFPSEYTSRTTLVWRDRAGAVLKSLAGERMYYEPSFDPGQRRIVALSDDPPESIWEVDVERGRAKRLILSGALPSTPTWSRDGRRIFLAATAGGKAAIGAMPAPGGTLQVLATPSKVHYPDWFSPDGTVLLLEGSSPDGKHFDVYAMTAADGTIRPYLAAPGNQGRGQFSPDGRLVAYTSDETGRPEVFVQTWPLSDARWQVSITGGDQTFWRRDGKELLYLAPDGKLMSVSVETEPAVSFGDPVVLFQTPLTPVSITGNRNQYLAADDGQRFLLLESTTASPTHLTLVQNFPRMLEEKR